MFCHNCGTKLPEQARFCPACGTRIPVYTQAPAAQEPILHTTPVQREQVQPEPVQIPVEQPRQEQIPVEEPRQQEQTPVHKPSADRPKPVKAKQAPVPKPKQQKKRIIQLSILLALIAAIGALIFFVVKKQQEVTVDRYKPRYDSESFLFTHDEFVALYNELLEENDIPIKIAGNKAERDNEVERYLTSGLKRVGYITIDSDPETGKIISVSATTNTDYEKKMSSATEAALDLLFEAACGPLSQEELQAIRQMPLVLEGEDTYIYTTKFGNVGLERWHVPTIYSMIATFNTDNWQFEGTQPEETTETEETEQTVPDTTYASLSTVEKYPEGEYRFNEEGFFFDHQEFADLFLYQMALDGIDYTLAKPTISNTGSIYYGLRNGEIETGLLLLQVNEAGRIARMAFYYEYSGDKNLDTQGVAAGLSFLQAGHGAMTNDRWSSMVGAEPVSENENYTSYSYDMDGLKIQIRKEEEGIRYMISADQ